MVEHTRTLGFRVAFAIGLGTMIAAGIFSLSGTAVAAVGSSAIISFVLAAVIAGITAYAYSEFASIYSENGGPLFIGASRTRLLRRWVLGSTPDQVIDRADELGVPVIVYARPTGVAGRLGEALTPLGRFVRRMFRRERVADAVTPTPPTCDECRARVAVERFAARRPAAERGDPVRNRRSS